MRPPIQACHSEPLRHITQGAYDILLEPIISTRLYTTFMQPSHLYCTSTPSEISIGVQYESVSGHRKYCLLHCVTDIRSVSRTPTTYMKKLVRIHLLASAQQRRCFRTEKHNCCCTQVQNPIRRVTSRFDHKSCTNTRNQRWHHW